MAVVLDTHLLGVIGMGEEMTKTQETSRSERPEIKASCELWDKFDEWMRVRGYQTRPEGLRAAMNEVTSSNNQSQQKID